MLYIMLLFVKKKYFFLCSYIINSFSKILLARNKNELPYVIGCSYNNIIIIKMRYYCYYTLFTKICDTNII